MGEEYATASYTCENCKKVYETSQYGYFEVGEREQHLVLQIIDETI